MTQSRTIPLLLVEDNPADARLIQEMIAKGGSAPFVLSVASCLSDALQRLLTDRFAVLLLDLGLPDSQGLDTLSQMRAHALGIPIVVLTGLDDEELALQALHEGAQDYIVKGQISGPALTRTLRYAMERKQAEETLRRSKEIAEAADRSKSEFLATMSHELRSPLGVIFGYLEMLLEGEFGPLSDKQRDALQRIDQNARGLFALISDVLDFNQLENGRLPIRIQPVRVSEVLANINYETQSLQKLSGLTFSWRSDPELPLLYTDPGKLQVIIKNLFTNAVKFTLTGHITVHASARHEGVEIAVCDTGIGIPTEQQERIFAAFQQVHSTPSRYGGVGLGLYIVRRLVEALGGRVTLKSQVGNGSTFRVWLPLSSAAAVQPSTPPEQEGQGG